MSKKLLALSLLGSSVWGVGCGGKKIANAFNKYDLAEEMGYKIQRFEPHAIESGSVIRWIQGQLERLDNGTDQTISTDRTD